MRRLIRSFSFAFKGLQYATSTQPNFRIHLVATVIAIGLGVALHLSTAEWQWIAVSIALVLVSELINTAIETLTDLVSPLKVCNMPQVPSPTSGYTWVLPWWLLAWA